MAKDKLSDRSCRYAPAGKHFDGGGLFLLVDAKGGRYWRQKYRRLDGKEDTLAHGVYPDVTLHEAREKRDAAHKLIKAGTDPKAHRRAAMAVPAPTAADNPPAPVLFSAVAEAYYEKMHRPWSATHRRDVRRMIDNDLVPQLGVLAIDKIAHDDVQTMFDKITERGALTLAKDVLTYFRAIWRELNRKRASALLDPSLRVDLPNAPKARGHAALAPHDVGPFVRALDHSDATPIVRIATRMLLLTAVRTTELRAATWGEFDTKAALWRIPEERMKAGRGHSVPLSRQTLALIEALRPYTGNVAFLFPNGRDDDRPMSENAILAAIRRMGYARRLTGHGMRAMFST